MTEEELRLWKDVATNATRGPWETGDPYQHPLNWYNASESNEQLAVYGMGMEVASTQLVQDAAFIAASREAMPALIDEVRRLRAERDALRTALLRCDRTCETVTHRELERHGLGERCPVVALIDAALAVQP
jgi:hypothetical protein